MFEVKIHQAIIFLTTLAILYNILKIFIALTNCRMQLSSEIHSAFIFPVECQLKNFPVCVRERSQGSYMPNSQHTQDDGTRVWIGNGGDKKFKTKATNRITEMQVLPPYNTKQTTRMTGKINSSSNRLSHPLSLKGGRQSSTNKM